jgi:hypothetical protein
MVEWKESCVDPIEDIDWIEEIMNDMAAKIDTG